MQLGARITNRGFELQNTAVALVSPRLAQRVRCSTTLGHFHKWYLGDGLDCRWCRLCRRFPRVRAVIPYSKTGLESEP